METEPDSWLYPITFLLSATSFSSFELILGVFGVLLLLATSALMAGSEVAFFSLLPDDFEKIEAENSAADKRILSLKKQPEFLRATLWIGSCFINISIVILSDFVLRQFLFEERTQAWATSLIYTFGLEQHIFAVVPLSDFIRWFITIVVITFLLVFFGAIYPKVYARANNIKLARFMSAPLVFMGRFFQPITTLLMALSNFIERRLARKTASSSIASREEIGEAIALTVSQDMVARQEIDILKSIVRFGDVIVKQIMRSRMDVVTLDFNSDYEKVITVAKESGYSRIPVYMDDFDNIKGILYVKDLLGHLNEFAGFEWQNLVRADVLYVPETKRISDLLKEFQRRRMHMAIVVDEYGGSSGIVTLEDIMEEVIGDIKDEFDDEPEVLFKKIDDLNYTFEGKTMLNDMCRVVGIDTATFDEVKGEADSLAGLILEIMGKLPAKDEEVIWEGFRFKIRASNNRRIEEVLLTLPPRR